MSVERDDPFAAGTWEGVVRARLIEESRLSFTEKLRWLEEAQRVAEMVQGVREKSPDER